MGRDTESVFPTEMQPKGLSTDDVKEALGGSLKFVTEKQVEEIKSKEKGGHGDAGAYSSKPLAQILSERKQQKDDEFQEKMKLLKQGKNRPLDADEIEFLEEVEAKKRKIEDVRRVQEETELLEFQLAREQRQTLPMGGKPIQKEKKAFTSQKGSAKPTSKIKVKPKILIRPAVGMVKKPEIVPESKSAAEEKAPAADSLGLLADYGSSDSD